MPKKKPDQEEIVGTTDASHILMVSAETVRDFCDNGVLPCMLTTRGTRFMKRADVERFAAERRKGPRAAKAKDE
jgi:predicted site-specific integrase-resolvase